MAKDKDGKLTYQMVSPGEAWNNFVNSKDGHNAAAVTPSYLDNTKDKPVEKANDSIQKDNAPGSFARSIRQQESISKTGQQQLTTTSPSQSLHTSNKDNMTGSFSRSIREQESISKTSQQPTMVSPSPSLDNSQKDITPNLFPGNSKSEGNATKDQTMSSNKSIEMDR